MIQLLADLLTIIGLLIIYAAAAVGISIAGTAAWLKAKELWNR